MSATSEIRESPILFSGPMVRALRANRKSQTRRVVSAQNSTVLGYSGRRMWDHLTWQFAWRDPGPDVLGGGEGYEYLHVSAWNPADGPAPQVETMDEWTDAGGVYYRVRPKLEIGQRLWVRETWGLYDTQPGDGPDGAQVYYRATDGERNDVRYQLWRPSIFMPRWACRIVLEVTDVRVQRLLDISEEDALAEGFQKLPASGRVVLEKGAQYFGNAWPSARAGFQELWKTINGMPPEDGKVDRRWDDNPWVWCISFNRIPTGAER
jgi:hypothetical protein